MRIMATCAGTEDCKQFAVNTVMSIIEPKITLKWVIPNKCEEEGLYKSTVYGVV